jgi:glycosyltransferase involved in cell wall biosynthesis
MNAATEPLSILFWFYKEPAATADRVAFIRKRDPSVSVYGLYGGPAGAFPQFARVTEQLDDCWIHPPTTRAWAWQNGDLMLAHWYRERGRRLPWGSLFIYQWDLLVDEPVSTYGIDEPNELVLPGVRPLDQVKHSWVWVQPWSTYYQDFEAFKQSPSVRGHPFLACVFIMATLSRQFLDEYSGVVAKVPGMLEYRLPTLAAALGYRLRPCSIRPDWEDLGDPLVNGDEREITAEQIADRRLGGGSRVWHPVRRHPVQRCRTTEATTLDSGRHAIGIMQVPPSRPGFTPGGAQVVAQALARVLAESGYQVHLICGTREDEAVSWIDRGVHHVAGFRVTPELLESGVPAIEWLPGVAERLSACDAVFMIDRVFPLSTSVRRILVLGATEYEFARTAVASPDWSEMLVPSDFVRSTVARQLTDAGQAQRAALVHVVDNPVIEGEDSPLLSRSCYSCAERQVRLLFPHRADSRKGADASMRLVAGLAKQCDPRLVVTVDRSATAEPGFYEALATRARSLGIAERLEMVPWQNHACMVALYASADLTLCLGTVAEGFGLVCLESILAGTPVLARDVGAQTGLLPPGHGCFVAPAGDGEQEHVVMEILGRPSLSVEVARGAAHIREHYSLAVFAERVLSLLRSEPSVPQ